MDLMGVQVADVEASLAFYLRAFAPIGMREAIRFPVGESFVTRTELLEVDGRKLLFRVEAHNPRELIGEGTLRRTIVREGRLG